MTQRDKTDPAKPVPNNIQATPEDSLTQRDKTDPAKPVPNKNQPSHQESFSKENKTNPDMELTNKNNQGNTTESGESISADTNKTVNAEFKDKDNIKQHNDLSEENVEFISDDDLVEEGDDNKNFVTGVLDLSSLNKELADSSTPENTHPPKKNKNTKKAFSNNVNEDEFVIEISKQQKENLNSSRMHSVSGCFSVSPKDLKSDDEQDKKPD